MINEMLSEVKHHLNTEVKHVSSELKKVQTVEDKPEIFDSLVVNNNDYMTQQNQVSNKSVNEPKLIIRRKKGILY